MKGGGESDITSDTTSTAPSEEGEEEGEDGSRPGDGEKPLVKNGFFSGEAFTDLPLSTGMLGALAGLNFTTTTKIQVCWTLLF